MVAPAALVLPLGHAVQVAEPAVALNVFNGQTMRAFTEWLGADRSIDACARTHVLLQARVLALPELE